MNTNSPLTIGGLNGNSGSAELNNDLHINTLAGSTNTFGGVINGDYDLYIAGLGTEILTGVNTYGNTFVESGTLELDGSVLNSVTVNGGTITGTGSAGQNLTFTPAGTYLVKLSGTPFATTCLHAGAALTPAGTLRVVSTNGTYAFGTPYTILTGDTLNSSRFTSVLIDNPWIVATTLYNSPIVQLLLTTNFSSGAKTQNQCQVAKQFDSITAPSSDEDFLIKQLLTLNSNQLSCALNQMSGEPYTYLTQMNQMADRRFNGRVFRGDPRHYQAHLLPTEPQAILHLDISGRGPFSTKATVPFDLL